ncbi:sulfatase [Candidatus Latescibacterota bacterium]
MSQQYEHHVNRREVLKRGLSGGAGIAGASLMGDILFPSHAQSAQRPNVIVIYTDDQDFDHVGCYNPRVYTPHQDSIGHDGIRFDRGYVTTGVCTPSRFGCLTGQFPGRNVGERIPDNRQIEVSFNQHNIASVMKKAGYTTGLVGKWDQGGAKDLKPLRRTGAWTTHEDEPDPRDPVVSAILSHNHDRYREKIQSHGFDYAESIYFGNPESFGNHALNIHNMEWVVQGAIDFIDQNSNKPFFLYMSPTLHHIPHPQESLLQADPRITAAGYIDKAPECMPPRSGVMKRITDLGYKPETAYCTWLDDGIGAVLKKLDDLNLADNTMVILVSDNANIAKGTVYEGGVRVPYMIRWPRMIKPGQISNSLAQNLDVAPTVFDACQATVPSDMFIDGKSLLPMLLGREKAVHDELFFEIGWTRAVCTERWKYLALRYSKEAQQEAKEKGKRFYHNRALEPHQHKVLLDHPNFWDSDQLYDMTTDNNETVNLAYDTKHDENA